VDVLLLSRPRSSSKQILVSHHYWHQERACYTPRVSAVESSEAQLLADTTPDNWRTLSETTPCLSIMIVASLSARSLYRVPLGPDGPVMAEPIQVYERVRDIILDSRGRIIFWTDDTAAIGLLQAVAD